MVGLMATCCKAGKNILILTDNELRFIHDIMYNGIIGGGSRRNLTISIGDAIRAEHSDWEGRPPDMSGHITFKGDPCT